LYSAPRALFDFNFHEPLGDVPDQFAHDVVLRPFLTSSASEILSLAIVIPPVPESR